jgi:aspartyl-tRNA(Asn)/glutamyl-tRNA(Gln) amidotransferase subunit B
MTMYEAVIGLETHIQLNTKTKIFCSCKADSWGAEANSNVCPVCTGLPGVLPVFNEAVAEKGVILAHAMHADVQNISIFDRKNYFYPDLPKGYQISQFFKPIALGGYLDVPVPGDDDDEGYTRRVGINRLHLEEDAGKSKHAYGKMQVDFNRCGVPLVEMVTEPDIRTAKEAAQYLTRLRQLLRWLGISEGDMEKGHLRCDANVSIREKGSTVLNNKTEIKNVNSIAAVEEAIRKEIKRQIKLAEKGEEVKPWTLEWDDDAGELRKMRSKETAADYRYFQEPDLLEVKLTDEEIAGFLKDFPEMPLVRCQRFESEYELPTYDAEVLTAERVLSEYFESAVKAYGGDAKKVSNWVMNDILRMMNDEGLTADQLKLTSQGLADMLTMLDEKKINQNTAKKLLRKVQDSGKTPQQIVEEEGLGMVNDDSAIRTVCEKLVADNPKEVENFRAGKDSLIGWFVGQVMREMRGKADPNMAREVLLELLKG